MQCFAELVFEMAYKSPLSVRQARMKGREKATKLTPFYVAHDFARNPAQWGIPAALHIQEATNKINVIR